MLKELNLYELGADRRKTQVHLSPLFPCSAYYTNWSRQGVSGTPWHWHEDIEFLFVLEGSVRYHFGAERCLLSEGDGLFVNRKGLHCIEMAAGDHCRVRSILCDTRLLGGGPGLAADRKYIRPVTENRSFAGMPLYAASPAQAEILSCAKKAHEVCAAGEDGYELDAVYELSRAVYLIGRLRNFLQVTQKEEGVREQRIRLMLDYIHEHYDEPVSLADLSGAAGICEREVQRCFRSYLKTSAMQYLQQYRVRMASQMLLRSDESVLQIGVNCGFANPSHFSKVFHAAMGCTPHAYRSKAASGEASSL